VSRQLRLGKPRHQREIELSRVQSARRAANAVIESGPLAVGLASMAKRQGAKQKLGEFAALVRLVRRQRPQAVVEIGTYRGGTLRTWCRLADDDATVVSVDLPGGEFGGGYSEGELDRLRRFARRGQRLHLVRADSHSLDTHAQVAALLGDRPVDLLFIDGDHTYEGARSDFEMYEPFVRPGGMIAFHDVLPHAAHTRCEVHLLWGELCKRYDHVDLSDPGEERWDGTWGGIGVILQRDGLPAGSRGD